MLLDLLSALKRKDPRVGCFRVADYRHDQDPGGAKPPLPLSQGLGAGSLGIHSQRSEGDPFRRGVGRIPIVSIYRDG
jgi:hypothetical protein